MTVKKPSKTVPQTLTALALAAGAILIGCQTDQAAHNADRPAGAAADQPGNQLLATNAAEIPVGPIGTDAGAPANEPRVDLSEDNVAVWSAVPASIIDTNAFDRPIQEPELDGTMRQLKDFLPKHTSPRVPRVPENDLTVDGGLMDEPRVLGIQSTFDGISDTGFVPPDPSIAVGPGHIVQVVNSSIAFYTRGGTRLFQAPMGNDGDPGFFEEVGAGDFVFDPKVFYDHYSERFVVVALEVYGFFPDDPRPDASFVTIAVSDDDDPNGFWFKYRTNALTDVNGELFWWDYPGFGFDQDAWYVNCNLFNIDFFGDPGSAGVGYRVFDKTAMLNGDPAVFATVREGSAFSMQATQHFGDNPVPFFLGFNNSNTLRVSAIENPLTNPTVTSTTVSVPSISEPDFARTAGGGSLNTVRLRIMNVQWRDGSLYGAHAVGVGGRNIARWYELETNNWPATGSVTLAQSGEVDPGGNAETFFPAIYSNADGDVTMFYGRTGADELISFAATSRAANDPPGFMGLPVEIAVSPVALYDSAAFRWGDYYDIAIDPLDDTTFWGVGQLQLNTNGGPGWGTVITELASATDAAELAISLTAQLPTITPAAEPFTIQILANPRDDVIIDGPIATVFNSDETVTTYEMDPLGNNLYEVTIPAPGCNQDFQFAFSAVGQASGTVTLPEDNGRFLVEVGAGEAAFQDDFEEDLGWTVTGDAVEGVWNRGVPLMADDPRGAPISDADRSGSCYLTDNTLGNTDVDGGSTILTSPNLIYSGSPTLTYSRWFHTTSSTDPDSDIFVVELSHDDGATWTNLETVGPGGPENSGGWIRKSFTVAEFVPITGQLRVRFIASDDENPSVVEAGVDGVRLNGVVCCPADWDFSGGLNVADFVLFVNEWNAQVPRTDINEDGIFNILDVLEFFFAWSLGCENIDG